MVKKGVFEWIKTGQKTIELRKGKAKSGEQAVFQCGRNIIRGKIISKDEEDLLTLLRNLNFREIIPTAESVEQAIVYIKKLYGTTEGTFTAYRFALQR
jgi:ASC-1-like (ASCH) protein